MVGGTRQPNELWGGCELPEHRDLDPSKLHLITSFFGEYGLAQAVGILGEMALRITLLI